MKINPHIFRGYDIRGKVDEDLNEEVVEAIGKAYATFLQKRKIKQAIVGHDHRLTGPAYKDALIKGIASLGIDVIDIGLVMSPVLYFSQYRFQANGAVMVTASHNPKEYNGFKLATGFSETMGTEELQEMLLIIQNDSYGKSETSGSVSKEDIAEDYIKDVLKRIKLKKKFKVVVDTGNGSAGPFMPKAIKAAGCDVIEQNTEVDGNFPTGTPDPVDKEVIDRISEAVKQNNADIGMAFDGDGDRIGVVDEKGRVLWNDILVSIFAKEVLARFPGAKIVYNSLCSKLVKSTIEASGGVPIIWRTGHSFIKSKAAAEKAMFGGELSGHFFFIDNFYGHDDACFAALRLLEYMSECGKTLGEIFDSFPKYFSSPEIKLGCDDDKKVYLIKKIANVFKKDWPDAKVIDDSVIPGDDGVLLDFEDGMMIVRYSQNGPYLTVKFESENEQTYEDRKKYLRSLLEKYDEVKWNEEGSNVDALK